MRLERRTLWSWRISMPLAMILTGAGGLGLAPLAALATLGASPWAALGRHLRRPDPALILAVLTVGWICLSWVWSPYTKPDQLIKLALAIPLFALLPFAISHLGPDARAAARPMTIFCALAALAYLALEAFTGGQLSMSYKTGVEGYEGTTESLKPFIDRSLSRAATPALIFGGPAVIMLTLAGGRTMTALAAATAALALIAAGAFNMHANMVALGLGLIAAAAAFVWPRRTLQALLCATAAYIVLGPVLMDIFLDALTPAIREAIPLSWAWRLEIWAFSNDLIAQAPLFGHGLDSARVLNGHMELRGLMIDLLPLHTHSAALHIWLEAGFIGAALAAATLIAIARWLGRIALDRPVWIALSYVFAVWFANVLVGYGIWQEWHHGALAFGVASAMLISGSAKNGRHLA